MKYSLTAGIRCWRAVSFTERVAVGVMTEVSREEKKNLI